MTEQNNMENTQKAIKNLSLGSNFAIELQTLVGIRTNAVNALHLLKYEMTAENDSDPDYFFPSGSNGG